jgi:hypothetical protein
MDKASAVLIANQTVPRPRPMPRLRLLVELEPRHRVFFDNLADLILARKVQQFPTTTRPARFWKDVFVPTGTPWFSFAESILLQSLLIVLFVWGQSRVWIRVNPFPQADARHRAITYYPPTKSFRAAESRASSARPRPRVMHPSTHRAARQPAMAVTPQRKPAMITPPDIRQATASMPNLPLSRSVTPMAPLSATADSRRNPLTGPSGVVAPAPQIDKATARHMDLPQASAIAPAPELAGTSGARAMKAPGTSGLPVVPPPPSVQSAGNPSGRLNSLAGAVPNVVPPAPSLQESAANKRLASMNGSGARAVPPPPSVQNAGNSTRAGRLNSLSSGAPSVVPPAPSVQGSGNSRSGAIAGAGSQVVPPPPSAQASNASGGSRLSSLSGVDSKVVPPAPSVENAGNSGASGRLGSLAGDTQPTIASYSGTGGPLQQMDPLPADDAAASSNANEDKGSSFEELPLGLLGVVFAAPGTSFFSNFEVFVAKRRVGKEMQLIKLVYEFLPYQRRLSEYDLNNLPPRVIKLKVTPDPSCNESLGQMMQAHPDPSLPANDNSKLPEALRSTDLNAMLPCYRTTAGDFQRAMSRGR